MPKLNIRLDADTVIDVEYNDANTIVVDRCDFVVCKGSMKRTDEGYLRGNAAVAKVGILQYLLPNGTIRKELVPAETLFNKDSMSSLQMQPITDTHPPEVLLDKKTVKRRRVGMTGENNKQDGDFLVTSAVITDEDAIASVESGRQQLSPGYRCSLVLQKGIYKGVEFDAVQVGRRYNHVAICDRARGGSDLKLNLDSIDVEHIDGFEYTNEDAVLTAARRRTLPDSDFCFVVGSGENKIRKFPAHDAAHVRNALARLDQSNLTSSQKAKVKACLTRKAEKFGIKVSKDSLPVDETFPDELYILSTDEMDCINQRKELSMPKFKIGGIDYDAAQEVINHITSLDATIETLRTEVKAANDSVTVTEAKLDEATEKLDAAENRDIQKEINEGVTARLSLMKVANDVFDGEDKIEFNGKKDVKVDSLSDLDIKKAVILKRSPNANLDEKDEIYITARFDAVVDGLDFDPDAAANNRKKSANRMDNDNADPVEKARQDSEERITKNYENIPEQYRN